MKKEERLKELEKKVEKGQKDAQQEMKQLSEEIKKQQVNKEKGWEMIESLRTKTQELEKQQEKREQDEQKYREQLEAENRTPMEIDTLLEDWYNENEEIFPEEREMRGADRASLYDMEEFGGQEDKTDIDMTAGCSTDRDGQRQKREFGDVEYDELDSEDEKQKKRVRWYDAEPMKNFETTQDSESTRRIASAIENNVEMNFGGTAIEIDDDDMIASENEQEIPDHVLELMKIKKKQKY